MIDRRYRLARWRNLTSEIIQSLPVEYRAHIFAQLERDARNQFALSRIAEFNAGCAKRWSRDLQICSKLVILLLGAFTFSLAPHLLAVQSGGGEVAKSIGFLGGAIACFLTHACAAEVLTDVKLKQDTRQRRKTLIESSLLGEQ